MKYNSIFLVHKHINIYYKSTLPCGIPVYIALKGKYLLTRVWRILYSTRKGGIFVLLLSLHIILNSIHSDIRYAHAFSYVECCSIVSTINIPPLQTNQIAQFHLYTYYKYGFFILLNSILILIKTNSIKIPVYHK